MSNNHQSNTNNQFNAQLLPPIVNGHATVPTGSTPNATNPFTASVTTPEATSTEPEFQLPNQIPVASQAVSENNNATTNTNQEPLSFAQALDPSPNANIPQATAYSAEAPRVPAYPEEKLRQLKEFRKRRQRSAAIGFGAIGLVFLGPLGAVIGAYAGNSSVKASGRRLEQRVREDYFRQVAAASASIAH